MEWNELVRPPLMADLLDQHFFPKWLQVLTVWLNTCPNYDQVMAWYSGWKSVIPPHLLEEQRVKGTFTMIYQFFDDYYFLK